MRLNFTWSSKDIGKW